MNQTVRYILKSIVHTHGLAFSRSQRLCTAYLADLMPDFPAERRQLVAAVADGLPHKLLLTQTSQQRKELALQFGQTHSIPAPQALAAAETWFYALKDLTRPQQASSWLTLTTYLGGVLTGVVILLVGSAIAFYKKLDEPLPRQQASKQITLSLPQPALSKLTLHPVPTPLPSSVALPQPQPLAQAPMQAKPTVDSPFLLSLASPQWTKLDTLDTERESIQSVLLQTQPLASFETPIRSAKPEPEPEPKLESNSKSEPTAKPKLEPITQPKPQPALKAVSVAAQPRSTRPSSPPEKPIKQATPSTPTQVTAKTKTTPTTSAADRTEIKPLFTKTAQAMQTLVEQVLRLRKKQADRAAVIQLLNLTGDAFYRQQLTELEQQIKQLQLRLDHLSGSYTMQVAKLCSSSPTGWQNGKLSNGERDNHKIQQWVLQDWKQCQGLSSQQIKQQLLTHYQILP